MLTLVVTLALQRLGPGQTQSGLRLLQTQLSRLRIKAGEHLARLDAITNVGPQFCQGACRFESQTGAILLPNGANEAQRSALSCPHRLNLDSPDRRNAGRLFITAATDHQSDQHDAASA
ncbi:hypothetical protein IBA8401_39400 [Pseudomonas syringae]